MTKDKSRFSIDWRVAFGLGVTLTWITTGLIYLLSIVGWNAFVHLPTADIGSFLEGAFAPLAFLWLVIGHFMQQSEITANTKAITLQEQSARRLELHSQRDSYFKLLSLVQDQLGSIAGFHYMSVLGPAGSGEVSAEELAEERSQAAAGDPALFVRKMIALAVGIRQQPEALQELFFGTEIRTRHSNNFTKTFSKLLDAARAVDTEDMVSDALLYGSAAGMLYRIILHVRGEECIDSLLGVTTAQPGEATAAG
jgi:hypothetical protein